MRVEEWVVCFPIVTSVLSEYMNVKHGELQAPCNTEWYQDLAQNDNLANTDRRQSDS